MTESHHGLRPVDFDPFASASEGEPRLPLTEPQAEIWTAAAMGREANCSYNQCFAFELDGPLSVASLSAALDGVVARHEALRVVVSADGTGQTIRPPFPLDLSTLDLSSLEPGVRLAEIAARIQRECETPFDLAKGPLLRAFVVRESVEHHHFVLTVHHIVCDGWASSVVFSDLGLLYRADRLGIPAQLRAPASYRTYVSDQTGDDSRAAAAADEDQWAAQFLDGAPLLELPLRARRPAFKTYACAREELHIEADLYSALKRTGISSGATLFATVLAAYEVLLSRLSGQTDIVIGIPFAGQHRLEDSALVAHCVNTVPLRGRVDPGTSFSEHLRGVGQNLAWAQDHSLLTFGSLVRRLRLARDPSRTPLVPTTFAIDKVGAPFDFGDVYVTALRTPKSYCNFELQMNLVDSGHDLVVECDYNTDLFAPATLRGWLSAYEQLLRGIVASPDDPIGDLPLLGDEPASSSDDEAAPFVVGGGLVGVGGVGGGGGCLHERFEGWVAFGSERVAVVCGGESLSFGVLDRRANALALRLRGLGVGPGVLVGLRCERSVDVVVGVLGVLKAGGAYVPLDPAYPRERVEFMLEDSGVGVVVTEPGFAADFGGAGVELVFLDGGEAASGPVSGVGPESLAYVIYTSGSTGRPKGVLISHRNVMRLFEATDAWFGFDESDVWTLFHSYAFDFSVWEMWGALLHGGRLVVVPYWVSRSPEEFRELVASEGVTVLNQTPTAFRQFLAADVEAGAPLSRLRYVIFGGEALELSMLRPWFERYGEAQPRLINMYGITETTVHVTYRPITFADLDAGVGSVIGVPIGDLRVLLLDPYAQPVPPGVAGEMYVGGQGVSRGYLNRPELTDERFVSDPFGGPGKLYRSGDLARRLENGELEYLGRIDDQVKIHGYRIELGEIEAQLKQHPGLGDAVVVVREDNPGDKRLVAYVIAPDQPAGFSDVLKAHLASRLPDYMVPAHFVSISALPLTANGKLDRDALPAPNATHGPATTAPVVPITPTQQALAAIWSSVLHTPSISIHDNFFELGGDSLKAAQVVAALRSTFGVEAGMRHLFERPTIDGLAEIVDILAVSSGVPPQHGREREEIEI